MKNDKTQNRELSIEKIDPSRILDVTFNDLIATLTGILSSNKTDYVLSLGRLFQKYRSTGFFRALLDEMKMYRKKGKIDEGYPNTEQGKACIQEMLDFLDNDSPDEIRFEFMKKILLTIMSEDINDRDSVIPQQLLKISRELSSGEILVLLSAFSIFKDGEVKSEDSNAERWLNKLAEKSGLKYSELVEIHEHNLIDKNLLTMRTYSDKSGVRLGNYNRLTKMGHAICEYVEQYEKVNKED